MERNGKKILIKLPITVDEFIGLPKGCKECLAKAKNLQMGEAATADYIDEYCPDCVDDEKQFVPLKTHDHVDPDTIRHFFRTAINKKTGSETTSVMFDGNRLVKYQISKEDFIKKIEDFIEIIE